MQLKACIVLFCFVLLFYYYLFSVLLLGFDDRIITMRRRVPPNVDAFEYATKAVDKTSKLEIKFINSFKGMLYA